MREKGRGWGEVLRIYYLSEQDERASDRGINRVSCTKRSEREQGCKIVYKKV